MCGITGFIDFNKTSSEETLLEMSMTLAHRGPESGDSVLLNDDPAATLGIGHRRLSIIDLSDGGRQPMTFESLTISFNGEIFNYKELQSELTALGCVFMGNSDTEVILQAYATWGKKCLGKFIGMFAFVIYDRKKGELFCARDRAGVKPFFYYWQHGLFLFASELKAFHKHPSFKKEINLHAVGAFTQFGNIPTPHCIFKYCYKLQGGHTLTFSIQKRSFEIEQYWNVYDAYNKPKSTLHFKEALEKTESVLKDAFSYRMVADVPIGVFLSGGYDSGCLTALLQTTHHEKLRTFTIGVPDIGLNEAPYAKAVANYLDTDHTEIMCTQKEVLELITALPYYYDEPFADSSAIPTTLVCKMARRQVKVALSADGGDETFAGYNRYDYLIKYGKILDRIPFFLEKVLTKS